MTQAVSRRRSLRVGYRPVRTFGRGLMKQDGTPTAWSAILGIVAPAIVVVSIITVATIEH